VSIFWCPVGFPDSTALPPKTKFSSTYFCNNIIPKIVERMPFDLAESPRKLMLRMDNASPHRARGSCKCLKKFRIRPIRHPPYSPDLAPSDFYLFGKLKGAFAGPEFVSTDKLLLPIRELTGSIERAELESVFDAWEWRLRQCIQMKGEYVS
jgi:transposase